MAYSARLRADDRRPPRGALEPRDVDLDVDEACRAHRSIRHARVAFAHTAPPEFPAGPQDSQQLREDVGNGVHAVEAVQAVHNIYTGVGERRRTRQDRQRAGRDLLRERLREAVSILLRELDSAGIMRTRS